MATLYDERQTESDKLLPEYVLFRKRYRQLSDEELKLHDAIKDKSNELAGLISQIKRFNGADRRPDDVTDDQFFLYLTGGNRMANVVLAIRHLEDCVYRAVKALTT